MKEKLTKEAIMKKNSVAILSALTVIPLTALLLLTMLPSTLTGCFFNTYHARFDSGVHPYLDFDYVNSLESFGTTGKGDVYLIEDELVFEKALPGYDFSVDFDKQIAILYVYKTTSPIKYYLRSIKLVNGVLTAEIFNNIIYNSPVSAATVEPYFRGFLLIIDRVSFDSVEFINVHSGKHPR